MQCDHGVEYYVNGVLDDSIVACRYVKQAVERYVYDLKTGHERGLYFDEAAAKLVLDFFALLKLPKGTKFSKAGDPFDLSPWQRFIIWNIFGWKKADGTRRFQKVYLEVARKNGKSTFLGGLALYGMMLDGEEVAEIYSAATKEDQARLICNAAMQIAKRTECIDGELNYFIYRDECKSIVHPASQSVIKPLGSDTKKQDGLNPHFGLVDELHAHPDGSMWEIIESALGSRRQPLQIAITTAGFNKHCYCCTEIRSYTEKVLDGFDNNGVIDDSWFGIIYTLDDGDDWKDESVWLKANPNLDVSVALDYLQSMCNKAKESPGSVNNFLVKHLNIWTSAEKKFFNMAKWELCNEIVADSELLGKKCFGGGDLASKLDISSLSFIFPWSDDSVVVKSLFFCPKERAYERQRDDKVPYLRWAEQGYLILTPGDVVDYEVIKEYIKRGFSDYDITGFGYDPWNFEYMRQELIKDGVDENKMIEFGQTLKNMSLPTREAEKLVTSKKLITNNNPIMHWMAGNTVAYTDPNDNVRPVKNKSSEKIDGIVSMVMGLGLMMTMPEKKDNNANLQEVGI